MHNATTILTTSSLNMKRQHFNTLNTHPFYLETRINTHISVQKTTKTYYSLHTFASKSTKKKFLKKRNGNTPNLPSLTSPPAVLLSQSLAMVRRWLCRGG
jgi:hypothetical protein